MLYSEKGQDRGLVLGEVAKRMRKQGEFVVFNIAHREKDHVTLGEDGLDTLRLLLDLGKRDHFRFLRKQGIEDKHVQILRHSDKYVEELIRAAKKVVVEVDWDKWAKIEKELTAENRRLNT